MQRVDFDSWSTLARSDPARFERQRRAAIEAFMEDRSPDRRIHLERLQWRIDRERARCRTPMAACIRLSEMMWDRFAGRHGLAETLQKGPRRPDADASTGARVLAFRRPRDLQ